MSESAELKRFIYGTGGELIIGGIVAFFSNSNISISAGITAILLITSAVFICSFYCKIFAWLNSMHIRKLFIIKVTTHILFISGITIYINLELPINNPFSINEMIIFISLVLLYIAIVTLLPKRKFSKIGFVSTCFPLKYSSDNKKIETRLILNPKHDQWMFPGGHVNIQNKDEAIQVAKNKAKREAGIEIKQVIDDGLRFSEYNHCKKVCSPSFTYRMLIDYPIDCGHNEHIDYIFIGEYERINDKGDYEYIDVEIEIENISMEKIKNLLEKKITDYYKDTHNGQQPKNINLLQDIPERLHLAIQKRLSLKVCN
jgi:hypothetical protein